MGRRETLSLPLIRAQAESSEESDGFCGVLVDLSLGFLFVLFFTFVCGGDHVSWYLSWSMKARGQFNEVSSFYHVGYRDQTRLINVVASSFTH